MTISYILMRFPALSETFAGIDVRMLREAGADVCVHTMRAPKGNPGALLDERGLTGLPVSQATFRAVCRGFTCCLRRPMLVARLVFWLFRVTWKAPRQLVKSLLLVPRSVGILAELERRKPDIVHLFWGHYPSIVGYLVSTTLPQSVVSLFLGAYDLTCRYGGTAWVARHADLVSTHARCNVASIEALGAARDRIHLAYRGIDLRLFDGRPAHKVSQRIVCAGRLDSEKGAKDVLHVFREIRDRWPGATLRILGEGPEHYRLQQLSKSLGIDRAVTFVGHVPQSQVGRELSEAEVFLHMSVSRNERLPNVVKEAMASHCVCVVSRTPGIEELIEDGRNGFVVAQRQVKEAAARIDDVFASRIDKESLVRAASSHIHRHFNAAASMRSYHRHWHDAVTRRGAAFTSSASESKQASAGTVLPPPSLADSDQSSP